MSNPPTTQQFHPASFGKFFLLQKIAAGGMAEIYRAKAAGAGGFEKELAVKRILPNLSADQQFVRMLVNEAKLTVALTHPTIAQIYELGEVDSTYFISMEFVDGATLHDLLYTTKMGGKPLTIEQSIYICLELLRGLDYAHRKTDGAGNPLGIVHCDVSPDNAMVTWDGGVKLLDFGIARATSSLSNYKEGTLMGKLNYVAPEQATGDWFDHRVDTFAVGVLLYELLTGTHPFGRVQTLPELKESRLRRVAPPSEVKPGLPKMMDEFVVKSLAHDRDDRFQTAKEMADGLVDFLFPTPTLSVAEHLSVTMKELYRDRIEKQQRTRANDGLHIKVLTNAARTAAAAAAPRDRPADAPPRAPGEEPSNTKVFVSAFDPTGSFSSLPLLPGLALPEETGARKQPPRSPSRPNTGAYRASARNAKLAAGIAAGAGLVLGAGAAVLIGRTGGPTLVVLSEPRGAEVVVDGKPVGITPLVLEDAPVPAEGADVLVRLAGHREQVARLSLQGRHALKLDVTLPSALGTFHVDSEPQGARLLLDGKDAGLTPAELAGLRLDAPHRFDLEKKGFEPDSFILRPDDARDGAVRRTLTERPDESAAKKPPR